ncbi:hypothetical protein D3C87_1793710 [compost metagenome]
MGEQHLGTAHALLAQLGFVHLGQAHLADGGGSLQFVHFMGAGGPAQALHAFGDGTAGHHHNLARQPAIATHQSRQLTTPLANGGFVEATALVGHKTGAHLDHDAAGVTQYAGNHFLSFFGR